jgi:hypothetical protein
MRTTAPSKYADTAKSVWACSTAFVTSSVTTIIGPAVSSSSSPQSANVARR